MLSEVLISVVILALVTAAMAVGIRTAVITYHEIDDAAAAEMLLSTTMNMLRDEIADASAVELEAGAADGTKTLSYRDGQGGVNKCLCMGTLPADPAVPEILLTIGSADPVKLIPDRTATNDMHAEYADVELGDGVVTFTELKIMRDGKEFAGIDRYSVRTVDR